MQSTGDLKDAFALIEHLPSDITDSDAYLRIQQIITACIASSDVNGSHAIILSKLAAKLFSFSTVSSQHRNLLMFLTKKTAADICFDILLFQLQTEFEATKIALCISLISKYLLDYSRLPDLIFKVIHSANTTSDKFRFSYLVERTRKLISLPTLVSNALKAKSKIPQLFIPDTYFPFLLRHLEANKCPLFSAVVISQSCILGFGIQVWSFILAQIRRSPKSIETFTYALAQVPESGLEATIVPLLTQASHPHIVALFLPHIRSQDQLFRLFHRLLLLRTFSAPRIPLNVFGSLQELSLTEKTEKELGFPLLQVWADSGSLERTSMAQRIYISQALVTWVAFSHESITNSPSYSSIVSTVMSGITTHLACNIEERRVLGMAVGEWLVQQLQIGTCGSSGDPINLKFDYVENEAVRKVKQLFEPIPPYKPPEEPVGLDSGVFFEPPELPQPSKPEDSSPLDSDDDPDPSEDEEDSFPPLPTYPTPAPTDWPYTNRRPHYLRECLDGLVGAGGNSGDGGETNEIALSCFAHADELIRRHRGAPLDEVALPFAEALLHTEPPACPTPSVVNSARHAALVALLSGSPKRSARYLTSQFNSASSGLAVNQRHAIIGALTDAACEMATKGAFGEVAGEFFFPMLRGAETLSGSSSSVDVYAHLDNALLARVVASLGTMFACGRSSPQLPRMAECLLGLATHLINACRDPAVRRSCLSAVGVVLTITPTSLLASKPDLLLAGGLADKLVKVIKDDADEECRQLAGATLSALRDCTLELIGGTDLPEKRAIEEI